MNQSLKRGIAASLILVFLMSPETFAQNPRASQNHVSKRNASAKHSQLRFPKETARVEQFFAGKNKKQSPVILIRDAHNIPDAQENIKKIIQILDKQFQLGGVGVEGSAQPLTPDFLQSFPDKKILQQVLKKYIQVGELTGPQAAAILSPADSKLKFVGIEDWQLYLEGIRLYRQGLSQKDKVLSAIQKQEEEIRRKQKEMYSPELWQIVEIENRILVEPKQLPEGLKELSIIEPATSKSLRKLIDLSQMPDKSLSHKMLEAIRTESVFHEVQSYFETLKSKRLRDNKEKSLDSQARQMLLLKRLVSFQLSRSEWATLNAKGSWNLLGLKVPGLFSQFYQNAEAREKLFLKNLEKQIAANKKLPVVLVVGGFHTEGLCESLKKDSRSFAVITPTISDLPEEDTYEAQMRGQFSWAKYFEIKDGKVDLYEAFMRGMRDQLLANSGARIADRENQSSTLYATRYTLKHWRDQIIFDQYSKKQIVKSGEVTRFLDELNQSDAGLLHWSEKVKIFSREFHKLHSANRLTERNILRLLQASKTPTLLSASLVRGSLIPENLIEPLGGDNRAESRAKSHVSDEAIARAISELYEIKNGLNPSSWVTIETELGIKGEVEYLEGALAEPRKNIESAIQKLEKTVGDNLPEQSRLQWVGQAIADLKMIVFPRRIARNSKAAIFSRKRIYVLDLLGAGEQEKDKGQVSNAVSGSPTGHFHLTDFYPVLAVNKNIQKVPANETLYVTIDLNPAMNPRNLILMVDYGDPERRDSWQSLAGRLVEPARTLSNSHYARFSYKIPYLAKAYSLRISPDGGKNWIAPDEASGESEAGIIHLDRSTSVAQVSEKVLRKSIFIELIDLKEPSRTVYENRRLFKEMIGINQKSGWDFSEETSELLEAYLNADQYDGYVLRAHDDYDRGVGYALLDLNHNWHQASLSLLVVRQDFHRRGIGSRLFDEAVDLAVQRNMKRLILDVDPDNKVSLEMVEKNKNSNLQYEKDFNFDDYQRFVFKVLEGQRDVSEKSGRSESRGMTLTAKELKIQELFPKEAIDMPLEQIVYITDNTGTVVASHGDPLKNPILGDLKELLGQPHYHLLVNSGDPEVALTEGTYKPLLDQIGAAEKSRTHLVTDSGGKRFGFGEGAYHDVLTDWSVSQRLEYAKALAQFFYEEFEARLKDFKRVLPAGFDAEAVRKLRDEKVNELEAIGVEGWGKADKSKKYVFNLISPELEKGLGKIFLYDVGAKVTLDLPDLRKKKIIFLEFTQSVYEKIRKQYGPDRAGEFYAVSGPGYVDLAKSSKVEAVEKTLREHILPKLDKTKPVLFVVIGDSSNDIPTYRFQIPEDFPLAARLNVFLDHSPGYIPLLPTNTWVADKNMEGSAYVLSALSEGVIGKKLSEAGKITLKKWTRSWSSLEIEDAALSIGSVLSWLPTPMRIFRTQEFLDEFKKDDAFDKSVDELAEEIRNSRPANREDIFTWLNRLNVWNLKRIKRKNNSKTQNVDSQAPVGNQQIILANFLNEQITLNEAAEAIANYYAEHHFDDDVIPLLVEPFKYFLEKYKKSMFQRHFNQQEHAGEPIVAKSKKWQTWKKILYWFLNHDGIAFILSPFAWMWFGSFIGGATLSVAFGAGMKWWVRPFHQTVLQSLRQATQFDEFEVNRPFGKEDLTGESDIQHVRRAYYREIAYALEGEIFDDATQLNILSHILDNTPQFSELKEITHRIRRRILEEKALQKPAHIWRIFQSEISISSIAMTHPQALLIAEILSLSGIKPTEIKWPWQKSYSKENFKVEQTNLLNRLFYRGLILLISIGTYLLRLVGQHNFVKWLEARLMARYFLWGDIPGGPSDLRVPKNRSETQENPFFSYRDEAQMGDEIIRYIKELGIPELEPVLEELKSVKLKFGLFRDSDWFPFDVLGFVSRFAPPISNYQIDLENRVIYLSSSKPVELNALLLLQLSAVLFQHQIMLGGARNYHLPNAAFEKIQKKVLFSIWRKVYAKEKSLFWNEESSKQKAGIPTVVHFLRLVLHALGGVYYSDPDKPGIIYKHRYPPLWANFMKAIESFTIAGYLISENVLRLRLSYVTDQRVYPTNNEAARFSWMSTWIKIFKPLLGMAFQIIMSLGHLAAFVTLFGGIILSFDLSFLDDLWFQIINYLKRVNLYGIEKILHWILNQVTDGYYSIKSFFGYLLRLFGFDWAAIRAWFQSIWDLLLPLRDFFKYYLIPFFYRFGLPSFLFLWGMIQGYINYKLDIRKKTISVFESLTQTAILMASWLSAYGIQFKVGVFGGENMPLPRLIEKQENRINQMRAVRMFKRWGVPIIGNSFFGIIMIVSMIAYVIPLALMAYPPADLIMVFHHLHSLGIPISPMAYVIIAAVIIGYPFSLFYWGNRVVNQYLSRKQKWIKPNHFFISSFLGLFMLTVAFPVGFSYFFRSNVLKVDWIYPQKEWLIRIPRQNVRDFLAGETQDGFFRELTRDLDREPLTKVNKGFAEYKEKIRLEFEKSLEEISHGDLSPEMEARKQRLREEFEAAMAQSNEEKIQERLKEFQEKLGPGFEKWINFAKDGDPIKSILTRLVPPDFKGFEDVLDSRTGYPVSQKAVIDHADEILIKLKQKHTSVYGNSFLFHGFIKNSARSVDDMVSTFGDAGFEQILAHMRGILEGRVNYRSYPEQYDAQKEALAFYEKIIRFGFGAQEDKFFSVEAFDEFDQFYKAQESLNDSGKNRLIPFIYATNPKEAYYMKFLQTRDENKKILRKVIDDFRRMNVWDNDLRVEIDMLKTSLEEAQIDELFDDAKRQAEIKEGMRQLFLRLRSDPAKIKQFLGILTKRKSALLSLSEMETITGFVEDPEFKARLWASLERGQISRVDSRIAAMHFLAILAEKNSAGVRRALLSELSKNVLEDPLGFSLEPYFRGGASTEETRETQLVLARLIVEVAKENASGLKPGDEGFLKRMGTIGLLTQMPPEVLAEEQAWIEELIAQTRKDFGKIEIPFDDRERRDFQSRIERLKKAIEPVKEESQALPRSESRSGGIIKNGVDSNEYPAKFFIHYRDIGDEFARYLQFPEIRAAMENPARDIKYQLINRDKPIGVKFVQSVRGSAQSSGWEIAYSLSRQGFDDESDHLDLKVEIIEIQNNKRILQFSRNLSFHTQPNTRFLQKLFENKDGAAIGINLDQGVSSQDAEKIELLIAEAANFLAQRQIDNRITFFKDDTPLPEKNLKFALEEEPLRLIPDILTTFSFVWVDRAIAKKFDNKHTRRTVRKRIQNFINQVYQRKIKLGPVMAELPRWIATASSPEALIQQLRDKLQTPEGLPRQEVRANETKLKVHFKMLDPDYFIPQDPEGLIKLLQETLDEIMPYYPYPSVLAHYRQGLNFSGSLKDGEHGTVFLSKKFIWGYPGSVRIMLNYQTLFKQLNDLKIVNSPDMVFEDLVARLIREAWGYWRHTVPLPERLEASSAGGDEVLNTGKNLFVDLGNQRYPGKKYAQQSEAIIEVLREPSSLSEFLFQNEEVIKKRIALWFGREIFEDKMEKEALTWGKAVLGYDPIRSQEAIVRADGLLMKHHDLQMKKIESSMDISESFSRHIGLVLRQQVKPFMKNPNVLGAEKIFSALYIFLLLAQFKKTSGKSGLNPEHADRWMQRGSHDETLLQGPANELAAIFQDLYLEAQTQYETNILNAAKQSLHSKTQRYVADSAIARINRALDEFLYASEEFSVGEKIVQVINDFGRIGIMIYRSGEKYYFQNAGGDRSREFDLYAVTEFAEALAQIFPQGELASQPVRVTSLGQKIVMRAKLLAEDDEWTVIRKLQTVFPDFSLPGFFALETIPEGKIRIQFESWRGARRTVEVLSQDHAAIAKGFDDLLRAEARLEIDEEKLHRISQELVRDLNLQTLQRLPSYGKPFKYGEQIFGREQWGGPVDEAEQIQDILEDGIYFMRVGPFLFLDKKKHEELAQKKPAYLEIIKNQLIIVDEMRVRAPAANLLGEFTQTTIIEMLQHDFSGLRVIDAGAGDGILSVVALKLGASQTILFDHNPAAMEAARKNMVLNGFREGSDFLLREADLRYVQVAQELVPLSARKTVLISNIGPTVYEIKNDEVFRLFQQSKDIRIVRWIAGGYFTEVVPGQAGEFDKLIQDQMGVKDLGYAASDRKTITISGSHQLAAWTANLFGDGEAPSGADLKRIETIDQIMRPLTEQNKLEGLDVKRAIKEWQSFKSAVHAAPGMSDFFDTSHFDAMYLNLDEGGLRAEFSLSSDLVLEIISLVRHENGDRRTYIFRLQNKKIGQEAIVGYMFSAIRPPYVPGQDSAAAQIGYDIFIPYRGRKNPDFSFDAHQLLIHALRMIRNSHPEVGQFEIEAGSQLVNSFSRPEKGNEKVQIGDRVQNAKFYMSLGFHPMVFKDESDGIWKKRLRGEKVSDDEINKLLNMRDPYWILPLNRAALNSRAESRVSNSAANVEFANAVLKIDPKSVEGYRALHALRGVFAYFSGRGAKEFRDKQKTIEVGRSLDDIVTKKIKFDLHDWAERMAKQLDEALDVEVVGGDINEDPLEAAAADLHEQMELRNPVILDTIAKTRQDSVLKEYLAEIFAGADDGFLENDWLVALLRQHLQGSLKVQDGKLVLASTYHQQMLEEVINLRERLELVSDDPLAIDEMNQKFEEVIAKGYLDFVKQLLGQISPFVTGLMSISDAEQLNAQFRSEVRSDSMADISAFKKEIKEEIDAIERLFERDPWNLYQVGLKGNGIAQHLKSILNQNVFWLREELEKRQKVKTLEPVEKAAKNVRLMVAVLNAITHGEARLAHRSHGKSIRNEVVDWYEFEDRGNLYKVEVFGRKKTTSYGQARFKIRLLTDHWTEIDQVRFDWSQGGAWFDLMESMRRLKTNKMEVWHHPVMQVQSSDEFSVLVQALMKRVKQRAAEGESRRQKIAAVNKSDRIKKVSVVFSSNGAYRLDIRNSSLGTDKNIVAQSLDEFIERVNGLGFHPDDFRMVKVDGHNVKVVTKNHGPAISIPISDRRGLIRKAIKTADFRNRQRLEEKLSTTDELSRSDVRRNELRIDQPLFALTATIIDAIAFSSPLPTREALGVAMKSPDEFISVLEEVLDNRLEAELQHGSSLFRHIEAISEPVLIQYEISSDAVKHQPAGVARLLETIRNVVAVNPMISVRLNTGDPASIKKIQKMFFGMRKDAQDALFSEMTEEGFWIRGESFASDVISIAEKIMISSDGEAIKAEKFLSTDKFQNRGEIVWNVGDPNLLSEFFVSAMALAGEKISDVSAKGLAQYEANRFRALSRESLHSLAALAVSLMERARSNQMLARSA